MPPKKKAARKTPPKKEETPKTGECTICFENFDDDYGLLKCQHIYCFRCIQNWSEKENTCPLCKSRFTFISRNQKLEEKFKKSRVTIKRKDQAQTVAREQQQQLRLFNPYQLLAMLEHTRFLFQANNHEDYDEDDDESFHEGDELEDEYPEFEPGQPFFGFPTSANDYPRLGGTSANDPILLDDVDIGGNNSADGVEDNDSFFIRNVHFPTSQPSQRTTSSSPEIIDLTSELASTSSVGNTQDHYSQHPHVPHNSHHHPHHPLRQLKRSHSGSSRQSVFIDLDDDDCGNNANDSCVPRDEEMERKRARLPFAGEIQDIQEI